jgi:hypothetical protein
VGSSTLSTLSACCCTTPPPPLVPKLKLCAFTLRDSATKGVKLLITYILNSAPTVFVRNDNSRTSLPSSPDDAVKQGEH